MGDYSDEQRASQCKAHTDRTQIFYRTCEMVKSLEICIKG